MMTEVPNWKFGQVVHSPLDGAFALVLGWEYVVDYNPSESIVILMALTPGSDPTTRVGEVFAPYCGWWEAVDV